MRDKNHFAGMHLIIDAKFGYRGKKIVSNRNKMSQYLEDITKITGMTLVMPPVALKFPFASETHRVIKKLKADGVSSPFLDEFIEHINKRDTIGQGVSALSMWLESHCALHSWTHNNYNYISIDLFSCKEYDYKKVLKYTKSFMRLKKINYTLILRQTRKPAIIEQGEL